MKKRKVQITAEKKKYTLDVPAGTNLLQALEMAGIEMNAPCGGNGTCGKCKVIVNGEERFACRTLIKEDVSVQLYGILPENDQILLYGTAEENVDFLPGELPSDTAYPYLAAVDLGTTTVVAYLIDGITGQTVGTESILNSQKKFGLDVVERCNYSIQKGRTELSQPIRRSISGMLERLAAKAGSDPRQIVKVVMVGNTGMHHLFLEYPTERLALAPYVPYRKEAVCVSAAECDLGIHPDGKIFWLPLIGGFVGADTVACLLAAKLQEKETLSLLVDIGTNGEMVLGSPTLGWSACATAAGPAFEGAKISCGMRSCKGAIDKVFVEEGKICYHVIGEGRAIGICGSGLLDAAACLLQMGVLDSFGRLKETYYFNQDVYLNQQDIRELQLAKAAIAAGIRVLCKKQGVSPEEIQQVLLAGAFGNWMDVTSACAIGMLPDVLCTRVRVLGNAAGEGAVIAAKNINEYEKSKQISETVQYVELASEREFQEIYIEEMNF